MIDRRRFAINRITCPNLDLDQFFALTQALELGGVELRNDLPGGDITDGRSADAVKQELASRGLTLHSINALQKFNLGSVRARAVQELERLADLAQALGCDAIVLCPNNDTEDRRPAQQMFDETVAALQAMRPLLESRGLTGLVEPLGFGECSLRSGRAATRAIEAAGGNCFGLVHDTFHHHLGPDSADLLNDAGYASRVGLVHLSGVEAEVPNDDYRDPHRVLVGPADKLDSRTQIHALSEAGYSGPISFEPFAAEVQALGTEALRRALQQSIEAVS